MPWKISYLEDLKIIQTTYLEPFSLNEAKEAVLANAAIAQEKQTGLFLGDCSTFTQSGETLDIYELGVFLEKLYLETRIMIKEAMVAPISFQNVNNDLKFFETVANNRMIKVRIFQDIQSATDWLVE